MTRQQFGWRHALIETAVINRLIADDRVASRFDFELDCAQVLYEDFHMPRNCNWQPNEVLYLGRIRSGKCAISRSVGLQSLASVSNDGAADWIPACTTHAEAMRR